MVQQKRLTDVAMWAVISVGIALSFIQFVFNRSITLDEASLGLNILDRSFVGLLKPLDYVQVAPILFLWIEKALSFLASGTELTLRVFPWLAWCGSLFFFWGILKKTISNPAVIVFALAMFALDPVLLRYSSELKQYMSDVLLTTALTFLMLQGPFRHRLLLIGATGLIGIALSNIAPIVLVACGAFLIYEYVTQKQLPFVPLLAIAVVWALAFLLYFWVFISHHPSRSIMDDYWARNDAFMPWNPLHRDFWHFFKKAGNTLIIDVLNFGLLSKFLFPVLFALGVIALAVRRQIGVALILIVPIAAHILVSGFRMYPFGTRLILYLAPASLLLVSLGLDYLCALVFRKTRWPDWALAGVLVVVAAVSTWHNGYPIQDEEIKKSMDYLAANTQDGDLVYVYYGAANAVEFYQRIGHPLPVPAIFGSKAADQEPGQILDLEGRNWLLFAHSVDQDEQTILAALSSHGLVPTSSFHAPGSSAYLIVLPAHPAAKTN